LRVTQSKGSPAKTPERRAPATLVPARPHPDAAGDLPGGGRATRLVRTKESAA